MHSVNLLTVDLDHSLDEAGFRHAGTSLRKRLGSQQIGAGVYAAEAGDTIWPYHYHHGVEEWLYVLAGKPVLRDPRAIDRWSRAILSASRWARAARTHCTAREGS